MKYSSDIAGPEATTDSNDHTQAKSSFAKAPAPRDAHLLAPKRGENHPACGRDRACGDARLRHHRPDRLDSLLDQNHLLIFRRGARADPERRSRPNPEG